MQTTESNEFDIELNDMDLELASEYQQKTDQQHILDNPDTYIGSIENMETSLWCVNETGEKIIEKQITINPALLKLFDEGIVNCRDHVVRMDQTILDGKKTNALPVTFIDITIDKTTGMITMTNDGNGIDVAKHPTAKIWIPELVFGHLRTSTNFDKSKEKTVGGKNGFGFKLALIWSTYGSVETVDHKRGLKYVQEFKNNLDILEPPTITKCSKKPYTTIKFLPDYTRLGMNEKITDDMFHLFKRRVYDISAITKSTLKVRFNGEVVPVKTFQQYIQLYLEKEGDSKKAKVIYEQGGERWEIAAAMSPSDSFIQISFVNGIHTSKGGKHVEYILNQITRKMIALIEKKKKITVNANTIREQLILFIRCDIVNPSFDSQSKDFMTTESKKFGSKWDISDKFIEKLADLGVLEGACAISEVKDHKAAKKTDGTKIKKIHGIPKLIDANWAGTDKSNECILIFCEGESAKSGIVSGLSCEDRNIIGVYPMKGKLLNVRGETTKKIADNEEIQDIKKILGLEKGKTYTSIESLRYGRVLFMTDQDLDGSHIKGLCINLFETEWPSLASREGFLGFWNTPILKAKKDKEEISFYNEGEYQVWKETISNIKSWTIKYFKGLGTSCAKEFKQYIAEKKTVVFKHTGDGSKDTIDMVFNKKRAEDRKKWLEGYSRDSYLNTSDTIVPYEEFIHKELIHFSKYDCDRSIPNLMDGLKISLRKILYSAFKKGLHSEIKVAQFSGYVSEHSGYHHGEASLNGAIINMAQTFVGSNNINLFVPSGQFGTRLKGGKDASDERYIFTYLSPITRFIFKHEDDQILHYLNDDGFPVEPMYYAPIVPMILINGSKGIGTGFSTDILSYNPLDIIHYLQKKLTSSSSEEKESIDFIPYYDGFTGTIMKVTNGKFLIKGKYETIGPDTIRITELPIGTWSNDYKEFLETLSTSQDVTKKPLIKDFFDMNSDVVIDFTITFQKGKLEELEQIQLDHGCNGLEKQLQLMTTFSTNNMHLFDAQDKLQKYSTVQDIIDAYYPIRLQLYQTRKEAIIQELQKEMIILSNKTRYIQEILHHTIDLRHKNKDEITHLLQTKEYNRVDDDLSYHYLTHMPMDSVSIEKCDKLQKEYHTTQEKIQIIMNSTPEMLWLNELTTFEQEYQKFLQQRQETKQEAFIGKEIKGKQTGITKKNKKEMKKNDQDEQPEPKKKKTKTI